MPTYQYACRACGHQLEAVQSFSDAPLTVCPECDGALRKVFSSVGVVFKGSGFYRTDSRAGSDGKADSSSGDGKSGDGKDSTSTAARTDGKGAGSSSGTSGSSGSSSGSSARSSKASTPAAAAAP